MLIDYLAHNKIIVAAAPATIWPFVLDTNRWHKTQRLIAIGGQEGRVGERFQAVSLDCPDIAAFYIENVELVVGQRRTIRLETIEGIFLGFASWSLTECAGGTTISYDVYCRFGIPAEAVRDEVLAQAQKQMDENFAALRLVFEGEASG